MAIWNAVMNRVRKGSVHQRIKNNTGEDSKKQAEKYARLGSYFLYKGRIRRAKKFFDEAQKLDDKNWLAIQGLGEYCLKKNKLSDAKTFFDLALQIDEQEQKNRQIGRVYPTERTYNSYAEYYIQLARYQNDVVGIKKCLEHAMNCAETATFKNEKFSIARFSQGLAYTIWAHIQENPKSVEAFKKTANGYLTIAVRLNPYLRKARDLLIVNVEKFKLKKQKLFEMGKVLKIAGGVVTIILSGNTLVDKLDDAKQAAFNIFTGPGQDITRVVEDNRGYGVLHAAEKPTKLLGDITQAYQSKNYERVIELAEEPFSKIKGTGPTSSEAISVRDMLFDSYYNIGKSLAGKKQYREAIDNLKRAIELKSNHEDSNGWLGYAFFKLKDYEKAIPFYQKTIEINPSPFNFKELAHAYVKQGSFDQAIINCNEGLKRNPSKKQASSLYNMRGLAFKNKGNKTQANSDYLTALKYNPNNKAAKRNLTRL